MNAQDLIHPDDDFTREFLTNLDWNMAQADLNRGRDPSEVHDILVAWARDNAYDAEMEAAEYAVTQGWDYE